MTDPLPLPLPPGTTTVGALARGLQEAVRAAFPRRVWVVGEVDGLERSLGKRNWFFNLCENDAAEGRRYTLGAVIWPAEQRRLFGPGGTLERLIEPRDGIEIRALCSVDFYAPYGTLRLVVHDVDPAYTLGRIAIERQLLVERLTKEGVLERQKRLALASVPLRIGLVTSHDSAAYADFAGELRAGGVAFRVLFVDARMQGEDTVRTVVAALWTLAGLQVEAIALVRGGGSTSDLAWFDREEIARAIAALDVPVLTGIGHEIDTSVADLAAHQAFKTPTAVASFLAERGQHAVRSVAEARRRIAAACDMVAGEARELGVAATGLDRCTRALVAGRRARIEQWRRELLQAVPRRLRAEDADQRHARGRFVLAPLRAGVEPMRAALLERAARLRNGVTHALRSADHALAGQVARARLLDPRNVVRRGYAILRDADGRVVKDAARVAPGDRVQAELRDGRIAARVEGRAAALDAEAGHEPSMGATGDGTRQEERRGPGGSGGPDGPGGRQRKRPPRHPGQLEIW